MEADFWINRWNKNEIGFHNKNPHHFLLAHYEKWQLPKSSTIFLPLCGKTLDIAWLLSKGHFVIGAELVETAIIQLFAELNIKPIISRHHELKCYHGPQLEIWVGDIFNLQKHHLPTIDAIYDRAAYVALPFEMRQKYSRHLANITNKAPQLLITFEYDQSKISGPPFSIAHKEIQEQYLAHYSHIELLEKIDLPNGMKGVCHATESAYKLF